MATIRPTHDPFNFTIPPRTSSMMPATTTARARYQASDPFITKHTTPDNNVPLLEECPICLDNYSHETCVRITGIAGCNHRIGLTCLTKLLVSHAELEKKCPLCRAVWYAGPSHAPRRMRRQNNEDGADARRPYSVIMRGLTPSPAEGHLPQFGTENAATANTLRPGGQGHRVTDVTQRELINLDASSSDEDYDTQVQNFNDFTRDIENIRSRARNTQFPRHARRHSLAQQQSPRGAADQPTGPGSAMAGTGVGRLIGRGLNPFRPMTHDPSMRERNNDFLRRREARQDHLAARRIDADAPRLSLDFMPVSPIDGLRTPSPPSNDDAMDVVELPAGEVQQARDAVRARQLAQGETELTAREQRLKEREAALAKRERDIGSREQKVAQVVQTMRRQKDEMEAVMRRQKGELDDSLERT